MSTDAGWQIRIVGRQQRTEAKRQTMIVSIFSEVKSSMGVIVAAPAAGACAALPGAVIAMAEERELSEEEMAKAILASDLIGVFIATRWTFAAEVDGCQAEGGSAACMAGAALGGAVADADIEGHGAAVGLQESGFQRQPLQLPLTMVNCAQFHARTMF
jgi:L-serine deaminase